MRLAAVVEKVARLPATVEIIDLSSSVWTPLADYPAARLYRSDAGVASSGSATRWRLGVRNQATGVKALDPTTLNPPDGQGALELPKGRWLLMGGAPQGHDAAVVNTIWCSDDRGETWSVLLPNDPTTTTRPPPAHSFGHLLHTASDGVVYVYRIGSDPFAPSGNVWRVPASALDVDGDPTVAWEIVSTSCPTSGLALYNYGALNGVLYVMGGQTSIEDVGVAANHVYASSDDGATWTDLGAAPWPGRGAQVGPMPVLDGKLWLIGGGRYNSTDFREVYNDVWTFDGATWTQVLADGNAQLPRNRYHSVVAFNGRLWKFNGSRQNRATASMTLAGTTITRNDGGDFNADGFIAGANLQIVGSASNDGNRGIVAVTASTITVDAALVDEGPTTGVTLYQLYSDTQDARYSSDGAVWTTWSDPIPWGRTHAQAVIVSGDGIYLTEGLQTDRLFVVREHTGALVSAWADQGSAKLDLSQAVPDNMPILDLTAFRSRPGLVFTLRQWLALLAPDRDLADGVFEAYAVIKTYNFATSSQQGIDPPCVVVGAQNASSWNNFGLNGGSLEYRTENPGLQIDQEPAASHNDNETHVIAVSQDDAGHRLYVDGVLVFTGAGGTNRSWTGWDAIGAGYLGADGGAFVLGAFFVLTPSAPAPASFHAKVQTWAHDYF